MAAHHRKAPSVELDDIHVPAGPYPGRGHAHSSSGSHARPPPVTSDSLDSVGRPNPAYRPPPPSGVHGYDETKVARTDTSRNRIQEEIDRLKEEERSLLHTPGLSHSKIEQLKEKYFHRIMDLVLKLPREDEAPFFHPEVHIRRYGTIQKNVYNQPHTEYRVFFGWLMLASWIIMFIVSMAEANWKFDDVNLNPLYGPEASVLDDLGAKNVFRIRNRSQWYRLLTPLFLHAGVIHLILDAIILYRLGWSMEISFGHWRVAVIFLLSGSFGVMVSGIFTPDILDVGASGGLMGLLGALFGDFLQNHKYIVDDDLEDRTEDGGGTCGAKFKYLFELLLLAGVGFAVGLLPLLDNFSHLGGFVYGMVAGIAYMAGSVHDHTGHALTNWYTTPLIVLSVILQIALWLTAFSIFASATSVDGWCDFCEDFSCLPTDYWDCRILDSRSSV